MIWQTWRQHRAEASVAAVIFAGLVAAMLAVGNIARTRASGLGLPLCLSSHKDCSQALDSLHRDFHSIPPFTGALIVIPLLAGMFWAAPLVSREYEAGTHRLAWTQSVSPLRWICTKIALIFSGLAAATLVLGLLVDWTLSPLTEAFGGRYNSTWYDIQGLVPVACMLFALAVGVAASALIRRTVPAMAVTLFVYAAARIPVHWVRIHFAPLASRSVSVPMSDLLRNPSAPLQQNFFAVQPSGVWVQGNTISDSAGHAFAGTSANVDALVRYCPDLQSAVAQVHGSVNDAPPISGPQARACAPHLQGLSLRDTVHYQPASHFWAIQTVEALIFLGLTAAILTVAVLAVTRRRPI